MSDETPSPTKPTSAFEPLPDELDFPTMERRMLDLWAAEDTFERLRAKNADGPRWSFFDGPITANNPMGVHHAWGRTYKDVYQRYRAMRGYHQRYQNGFDCQGLWLEVEVEKDLGFNSKRDIEAFGLEAFADACRERVETFSGVQTRQSIRLGQWMDWDNSYYTHSDTNIEHIWHFLRRCNERGWIAAAQRAMPWCARCGTALSQHELIDTYEEVEHDAVYVRLPVQGRPDTWLLIWTTTPWTLAANVAAAVHPDLTYAEVQADGARNTSWPKPRCRPCLARTRRSLPAARARTSWTGPTTGRSTTCRLSAASPIASSPGPTLGRTKAPGSCTSRRAPVRRTSASARTSGLKCWCPLTKTATTSPATTG